MKNTMEPLVLNSDFEAVMVFDSFKSLLWVDRYNEFGDFEIYMPITTEFFSYLQQEHYIYLYESDHVMIIEDLEIKQDVEEGNYLVVTGRSLESILDRRIVWEQTILSGNFQNCIEMLLNNAIISPIIPERKINNFVFEASDDPEIMSLSIEAQIPRGTNLYDVVHSLCLEKNIGFKITLDDNDQFIFKLYSGVNRSYEQLTNPYVVFSKDFDNLINADYVESKKALKNVTLVAGEGEETIRKSTVVGGGSDLSRRELYTDAYDISQNDGNTVLTDEEYLAQLVQKGVDSLSKSIIRNAFESQIDSVNNLFKYNVDYFIGDVVQMVNDYGIESRARVMEIIHSRSEEGIETYPTLEIIDVGEFESDGVLIPGVGGGSTPGTGSDFSSSVRDTILTGLTLVTNAAITASDTILSALGKLQKQITDHINDESNPHKVTKADVGLENVDNESKITMFTDSALTGNPTAPTQPVGTSNTRIATTEFVINAVGSGGVGEGDMLKSVYDTNNNGVIDKAEAFIFVDGGVTYRGWFSVDSGVLTFNYEEVV